jgi:hypothetical protein
MMPGMMDLRLKPKLICNTCQREVDRVRGSMWHDQDRICIECFSQWYDPDNNSFDNCNPRELGNYVRSKHGLSPIPA